MKVANNFKKMISGSTFITAVVILLAVFAKGHSAWSITGNGLLDVDNNEEECPGASGFVEFESPKFFEALQNEIIHINISPAYNICTSGRANKINDRCEADSECSDTTGSCNTQNCTGNPKKCQVTGQSCTSSSDCPKVCGSGSPKTGDVCTVDSQCHIIGTCEDALDCQGDTTVFIKGHAGECEEESDCDAGQTCESQTCDGGFCNIENIACTSDSDCPGVCTFSDEISASVVDNEIDVCYMTRNDWCSEAKVAYCEQNRFANVEFPIDTGTFIDAALRAVDAEGEPIAECSPSITTCQNQTGSFCCGLTQGAYGAPNSVATAQGECDGDTDLGYIPAAYCAGCDLFDSSCDNATTIGLLGTNSVTIKNLTSLITWLPTGGTAGKLKSNADKCFSPFLNGDLTGGGSKGAGGGVLSGQTMASQINAFLSDECGIGPTGDTGFTASGFGGFTLPAAGELVCTQRSGPDKVLGSDDDICQAFGYANCVAGKTVEEVLACANQQLANGSISCGCTATELNNALSNINVEFDQCGYVIDCGSQTTAGTFTCP